MHLFECCAYQQFVASSCFLVAGIRKDIRKILSCFVILWGGKFPRKFNLHQVAFDMWKAERAFQFVTSTTCFDRDTLLCGQILWCFWPIRNGICSYSLMIPYGATFTVFFQYGLPAIRMAAISKTLGARNSGRVGLDTPKASSWKVLITKSYQILQAYPIGAAHDHLAHAWGFLFLYSSFILEYLFSYIFM